MPGAVRFTDRAIRLSIFPAAAGNDEPRAAGPCQNLSEAQRAFDVVPAAHLRIVRQAFPGKVDASLWGKGLEGLGPSFGRGKIASRHGVRARERQDLVISERVPHRLANETRRTREDNPHWSRP